MGYERVEEIFQTEAHTIHSVEVNGDTVIKTTAYHRFYVEERGWVSAINLKEGDCLITPEGQVLITGVEKARFEEPVIMYNFHVEDWVSYFVSELSLYVHNGEEHFKLPGTVKSGKGVEGKFSIAGFTFRIDTNKVAPGEGGFHLHIYRKNQEIAKITGRGGYVETHKGKTLLSPSQMDKTVRKEINKLVNHVKKLLK